MAEFDAIKNTRYIKALSEEDLQQLMKAMNEWPEERRNEYIEGILKLEESADDKVTEVMSNIENSVQSAVELIKKGERESRKLDEQEEQTQSLEKAEAALSQL